MTTVPPSIAPSADAAVSGSPSLCWSREGGWKAATEQVAVEAPLAIEISHERRGHAVRNLLAVTMRTPGSDEELAIGFVFAEGLIRGIDDVAGGDAADENLRGEKIATWRVRLRRAPREDWRRVSRGLITSSACGLCGRTSLEGLPWKVAPRAADASGLSAEFIGSLPRRLRDHQPAFARTGGCHGAALFDGEGNLILAREDVGRHNAVDKLVGAALRDGVALAGKILALSGRASFELVQKAAAAGVAFVVSVGAPSSLAISLAHAAGITLVGFDRGDRFNVYAHVDRLKLQPSERRAARRTSSGP
jgi:FdhD protein